VISTIFIPLTFLVGVYGMNFNPDSSPWNMPELNWYWGYPAFWGLCLLITTGLVVFFWRRGWFESTSGLDEESRSP
jgi:magnesium transporter